MAKALLLAAVTCWIGAAIAHGQWIPGLGPATQPAWNGPMSPAVLPGNGIAQHPFLYAGEWDHRKPVQTIYIVRGGKIVWSYSIPSQENGQISEFSDATLLSDNSVVFSRKTGARKITADKKTVWDYVAPAGYEVHAAQPVGLDHVLIIQNGKQSTLMLINVKTGKTETQFNLATNPAGPVHTHFRRVRMTPAGTFLVPHKDLDKVVEYDATGKQIWSVNVPVPWSAVRLKNGNTLVSSGSTQVIREFNPQGQVVWEFSQKDVPNIRLFSLQEADRLANGNTIISNWCPSAVKDPKDWPTTVQVLEVTREKKLVWALRSWDTLDLGPATCIQLLDEPGIPENLEQQR
jgi:outer membrane protein assembly factor BamB